LILHAVALAFDHDSLGMMQEAIEQSGCEGAIVVADFRPLRLLDRMYFLLGRTAEGHRLLHVLSLSMGIWIADRKGGIGDA